MLPTENVRNLNLLRFSTDSKTIAACSDYDLEIQLWDIAGRKVLSISRDIGSHSKISDMIFIMGNETLTCLHEDGYITEWDVATGHQLSKSVTSFERTVVSCSENGKMYVRGDRENGNIRVYVIGLENEVLLQDLRIVA